MFRKTVVLKVLENSQKNVLSNVPFKQIDLPNPPIYNHTETDSTANVSCECSEIFEIVGWASLMDTLFSKVTGEISAFCNIT